MIRRVCVGFDGVDCGRLAEPGERRCATHLAAFEQSDNRRRNEKTVRHGVKRAHFQRIRRERLRRAKGVCELRLRGCKVRATTVHLDPRLAGNHDIATIDDVRAACDHCHGVVDGSRSKR